MSQVSIEMLFPMSRAIKDGATGRITITEDVLPGESFRGFLERLMAKYRGLGTVYEVEKRDLNPMVCASINDVMLISREALETTLKDGDNICLFPQYAGG